MDKLGASKINLDELLDEVDKDKNGVIDYEGKSKLFLKLKI